MKIFVNFSMCLVVGYFFSHNLLFCQTLSPTANSQDMQLVFSSSPTTDELHQVFSLATSGALDPFEALSKVVECKEKAIPALEAFLFAPTSRMTRDDSGNAGAPNKIYGVLALEAIGSQGAFNVLLKAAGAHSDKEIKGTAMRAIALNYYLRIQSDSLVPSKEFLHVLISNMEDTTWVEYCSRRIGEIAREGVKNLTGKDYGDLSPDKKMIKVGKEKREMTVDAYRELWWTENSAMLIWNKKTAHFEKEK